MSTTQWIVLGIGIGVLILGVVFIVLGILARRKLTAITETPTMSASEAAQIAGPTGRKVEVYGVTESSQPLVAPASGSECVYYRLQVEERYVDYDYDSSSGHSRRTESWRTVADDKRHAPFVVRDSSGAVGVDPEGAEFVAQKTVSNAYGAPGMAERGAGDTIGGVVGEVLGSALRGGYSSGHRHSEWIIPHGQETYVLGDVVQAPSGAVIRKGEGPFIISYKSEEQLTRKYKLGYILWSVFGAVCAVGGIVLMIVAATVIKGT